MSKTPNPTFSKKFGFYFLPCQQLSSDKQKLLFPNCDFGLERERERQPKNVDICYVFLKFICLELKYNFAVQL